MTAAIHATSLSERRTAHFDPGAAVPDWVVLGRIREAILAGLTVPESVCPLAERPDYIPALLAAGHTPSQIERATGVNAGRYHRRNR